MKSEDEILEIKWRKLNINENISFIDDLEVDPNELMEIVKFIDIEYYLEINSFYYNKLRRLVV